MIKVFVGDADTVETAVNQFMTDKGKDFPVRTNVEMHEGRLVYIATVFFDGIKKQITPIAITDIPEKSKSNKVGALWQKGNEFTGTIEDKKVKITKETWDNLPTQTTKKGDEMKILNLESGDARILKNQFKNTPNHPDYVVLQ